MLTLFTIPKPFEGPIAEIQLNALQSWRALGNDIQVVTLGGEVGSNASHSGHILSVSGNEHGTPRLDDAFAQVEAVARYPLWCFINADIILLDDFLPAVRRAAATAERFLMVGRTLELDGVSREELGASAELRARALQHGVARGAAALDYFVFPAGLFGALPPFLVGRACFDNWLVWRGRQQGPVIDASKAVAAIHQAHGYGHLAGGKGEAYYGAEAAENRALAGGGRHLYTLHDASHVMRAGGAIARNPGAMLRARETLRRSRAKLALIAASRPRPAG